MNEAEKRQSMADIVRSVAPGLTFTTLEVGALPIEGSVEPAHVLLDLFPGSLVIAFEVNPDLCRELNQSAQEGLTFHPVALGGANESRPFYNTAHPMCGSLYRPNERITDTYNSMEVRRVQSVEQINTIGLDGFRADNGIGPVDFMKLDIQGAELEVFKGGIKTLTETLVIVTEVMFIPMYEDQPLFGDQSAFLTEQGFMFHKFLGMGGRTIKPYILRGDPNFVSQHMWSDAVFMRSPMALDRLRDEQLLKQGVLMLLYGCVDVAGHCFSAFDERNGTDTARRLFNLLAG